MTIRHPSPKQLAKHLSQAKKLLDDKGGLALDRAELLASRGYPSSTNGNGSRSSDPTSSTERAVGLSGDDGDASPPDREWIGFDDRLRNRMQAVEQALLDLEGDIAKALAHDNDADPLPPGTGYCACGCEHYCSPKQNGDEDRLKNLLAPKCHRAFLRWRQTIGNPSAPSADYCTAVRRAREKVAEEQRRQAQLRADLRR